MKIERVDEKTVKAFISFDEMKEYEVDYKDFLTQTEKAQELMHRVVEQAREEVDYHPPKLAFEVHIMMIPDQGMVLTFSEKEPINLSDDEKVEGFMKSLQDLMHRVQSAKEEHDTGGADGPMNLADAFNFGMERAMKAVMGEADADTAKQLFGGQNGKKADGQNGKAGTSEAENAGEANGKAGSGRKGKGKDKKEAQQICEALFVFSSLRKVMQFAEILPANLRVNSALYKMDPYFYLYLEKGGASYDRFSRTCIQAMEFAALSGAAKGCDQVLIEHGELLIAEKALKKLR